MSGNESPKVPKVAAKIQILLLSDGNIQVTGPINNFVVFTEIMAKAQIVVCDHIKNKMASSIVQPEVKIDWSKMKPGKIAI